MLKQETHILFNQMEAKVKYLYITNNLYAVNREETALLITRIFTNLL